MEVLAQTDNPVFWQEISHQQRSMPRHLRRWWAVGFVVLVLMIVGVALTLGTYDFPTRELAIYMIWLVHAVTVVRALVAGSNAISREHVGQTWDALILTGVSARQILFGKWRAALRQAAPWIVALGTIRLAMLPIFMIALTVRFAWAIFITNSSNYSAASSSGIPYYVPDPVFEFTWVPWAAVLAVVASVVLSILEGLACTALGLAASAIARRGIISTVTAFTIRFIPVALFAVFTRQELGTEATYAYSVLRFAPFSLADAGTASISRLAVPYMPWSYSEGFSTHIDALSGLALATALLIVLLTISLLGAWAAIRMTGALPHPKLDQDTAQPAHFSSHGGSLPNQQS
ncbi:MAG: hypothetical protein ABI947_21475 [Chloroflexota bacterium]